MADGGDGPDTFVRCPYLGCPMVWRRTRDPLQRLTARRRVWSYGAAAVVMIAFIAVVSVGPLLSGKAEVRSVQQDDVALRQVLDLRATFAEFQLFMEPFFAKLSTSAATFAPTDIAAGSQIAETAVTQTRVATATLHTMGLGADAGAINAASASFTNSLSALGTLIGGRPLTVIASTVATERARFTKATAATATAATDLQARNQTDAQDTVRYLDAGRVAVLVADVAAAAIAVGASLVLGRQLRRREYASRVKTTRRSYEATLQEALDMTDTEPAAYTVMTKALRESVPHLEVEMLVADSSGAHFHQTLHTTEPNGTDQHPGCDVVSPADCPAARRGHTLIFPSSQALNACPHLVGRSSGELSAACVAISITGRSSGVVHAMGPDGTPPDENDVRYLEITTRRASERIAMLRAFEKSETQARTDPLTGLWNRRSLENRVRELTRDQTPYALAYGDLDHFKILNDTHGHEAGDQALRLFARVLRESVRPHDITARYGGEEFVIVLPDSPIETATKILERLREQLALTLTSGRVPAFTVSFGLASSADADTFDEVVAIADQALLIAKTDGRNRTVRAIDLDDRSVTNQNPTSNPAKA
jgi:diguanylate cyclase (GGDEF)-like protein